MTSTGVGWVLVEGHDAAGTILDHGELAVRAGGGIRAAKTAEQMGAAVLRAEATATSHDGRVHVIGVTWSDEAAAEAALLMESLTEAGFDNVLPVRLAEAAETLAQGLAPLVGYDKTAVCVVEGGAATTVMVDLCDDDTRTAVKRVPGGAEGLVRWLTGMFDRGSWRPDSVVVVGANADLDGLSRQLDDTLPVPVLAQSGAELALARGAALASGQSAGFDEAEVVDSVGSHRAWRKWSRPVSYAGALTILVAAALVFVVSLSLAVGLRVAPGKDSKPTAPLAHSSAPPEVPAALAPAPAPAVELAPAVEPAPEPAFEAMPPVDSPTAAPPARLAEEPSQAPPVEAPVAPRPEEPSPAPEPEPESQTPLLTRVLEQIQGLHHDPAPAPAPDDGPPSP